MTPFSEKQIANWRAYEKVRSSGEFNMWAPQAREKAKLSKADYLFVMKNFSALKAQAERKQA